jgi:phospholipid-binding lipoprotein MlaA
VNPALRTALALLALLVSALGCATADRPDPLEKANRKIFAFNEGLDRYALQPVATAWDFVLPDLVEDGIQNIFRNLDMPVVVANDVLQAKPVAAFEDVARFFFNTTLGLAGFFDVATRVGIPDHDEDFGQTLGYWGVPPGPYLVVPILGPYTLRDGFGEIADTTATAYAYMNLFWYDVVGLNTPETAGASIGTYAFRLVNLRAIYLEEIANNRRDAFDYYAFVRNAYLQNRRARVLDATDSASAVEEDLYEIDGEGGEGDEDYENDDLDPSAAPAEGDETKTDQQAAPDPDAAGGEDDDESK